MWADSNYLLTWAFRVSRTFGLIIKLSCDVVWDKFLIQHDVLGIVLWKIPFLEQKFTILIYQGSIHPDC